MKRIPPGWGVNQLGGCWDDPEFDFSQSSHVYTLDIAGQIFPLCIDSFVVWRRDSNEITIERIASRNGPSLWAVFKGNQIWCRTSGHFEHNRMPSGRTDAWRRTHFSKTLPDAIHEAMRAVRQQETWYQERKALWLERNKPS